MFSKHSIKINTEKRNLSRGIGLIEVVIGASLISLSLIGIVLLAQMYTRVSRENTSKIQASFLIEGGMEGMRSIRDRSWGEITGLSSSTPYYLLLENNMFVATTTAQPNIDDFFERIITADDVYRDINGDIVESGGTYDPDTKKITTTVSWEGISGLRSENSATYIANLFE